MVDANESGPQTRVANHDRAKRVLSALIDHFEFDSCDAGATVTDLLADVRHFCDWSGLSHGDLDRTAHLHYLEELEEERHRT